MWCANFSMSCALLKFEKCFNNLLKHKQTNQPFTCHFIMVFSNTNKPNFFFFNFFFIINTNFFFHLTFTFQTAHKLTLHIWRLHIHVRWFSHFDEYNVKDVCIPFSHCDTFTLSHYQIVTYTPLSQYHIVTYISLSHFHIVTYIPLSHCDTFTLSHTFHCHTIKLSHDNEMYVTMWDCDNGMYVTMWKCDNEMYVTIWYCDNGVYVTIW